MISFLRGRLHQKLTHSLLLDVHGVGYEVRVTPRLLQAAREGSEIQIWTHFQVREDAQVLFGFADLSEREMFRTLLSVSGVGPKTAMAVLSVATPAEIIRSVQQEDAAALKAPGVGAKIVKRLISELKGVFVGATTVISGPEQTPRGGKRADVLSALGHLGYTDREGLDMIEGIDLEKYDVPAVVKLVLRKGTH